VLPEDTDRKYVFVAGGIGITVFRSMLRYIADERLSYRVTLVYSNRDRESAAFLDELRDLERRIPGFRMCATMTQDPTWTGETRRIGPDLLHDTLDDRLRAYTFLVAGPPPMVESVVSELHALGIPDDRLRADRFSGY
jgi:ferredoxin-NADP reductase